jgi:hypothetical protein
MEFVCYADWDQLPPSADTLFSKAETDSLFFSRPWFENLVNTGLDDDQAMLLACVVEDSTVHAILPLKKRSSEHWHALTHLYSSLYTLLLAEQNQQEILNCLVQGISRLPVYSLQLEPIDENDSNIKSLQQTMESSGFECHRYFRFYNWIHRVGGDSFTDYMALRPARVRNTIARKQRKLEREHGYDICLHTTENVQQAIADYNAIYQTSWKANELFQGFVEGMVNSFSKQGWLRLAILYIEGQPAAAHLWFVVHRKASIFRLAYDEAWKHYSPGSILIRYLMQHVIDKDKVVEIDFLSGNEKYKQDWMSERRERWGLYCVKENQPNSRTARIVNRIKDLKRRLID